MSEEMMQSAQGTATLSSEWVETAARAAHEVNRVWCLVNGQAAVHWEEASDATKDSVRSGVNGVFNGNTPEKSHESWFARKEAEGWRYGPVKDEGKKEHPCFVPYHELSAIDRAKDTLFCTTVQAVIQALAYSHKLG